MTQRSKLLIAAIFLMATVPVQHIRSQEPDLRGTYAYPVPFKPSRGDASITFAFLPAEGHIRIYSPLGEMIQTIPFSSPADSKLTWNVTNHAGEPLASDVYLYVVQSGSQSKSGKILVLR